MRSRHYTSIPQRQAGATVSVNWVEVEGRPRLGRDIEHILLLKNAEQQSKLARSQQCDPPIV
jgi:hypothetical protein